MTLSTYNEQRYFLFVFSVKILTQERRRSQDRSSMLLSRGVWHHRIAASADTLVQTSGMLSQLTSSCFYLRPPISEVQRKPADQALVICNFVRQLSRKYTLHSLLICIFLADLNAIL